MQGSFRIGSMPSLSEPSLAIRTRPGLAQAGVHCADGPRLESGELGTRPAPGLESSDNHRGDGLKACRRILMAGAELNGADATGNSLLHKAGSLLELLLQHGADTTAVNH